MYYVQYYSLVHFLAACADGKCTPQLKLYHEIVDSLVRSAPKLLCPGTRADFQTKKYVHTFEHQRTSFGALTLNIILPHHSALPQL